MLKIQIKFSIIRFIRVFLYLKIRLNINFMIMISGKKILKEFIKDLEDIIKD